MAWYALYKWFIQFRKTSYINYVSWFKQYLYDEWIRGLSEDEQKEELKRQEEKRRREELEKQFVLERWGTLCKTMNEMTGGRMNEYVNIYRDLDNMCACPFRPW